MYDVSFVPGGITAGDFEWDLDEQTDLIGEQEDALAAALAATSGRAQTAFSLACAEWIRACYGDRLPDHFRHYLASRWVLVAGWALVETLLDPRIWDAEDAPTSVADAAIAQVENTFYGNGDGEWDAALMSKLVEHVLADVTPFRAWQAKILPKLQREHPTGRAWEDQAPVHLDELDPTGPRPETRDALRAAMLSEENPFIAR